MCHNKFYIYTEKFNTYIILFKEFLLIIQLIFNSKFSQTPKTYLVIFHYYVTFLKQN